VLAIGKHSAFERAKKIATLSRKFFLLFIIAEGLSLAGTIASQMAISLAPAVSFVAVIESLVPVFVMLISLFLIRIMKVSGQTAIGDVYKGQLSGAGIKIIALAFIVIGISIVV
jgi:hypothetical protein